MSSHGPIHSLASMAPDLSAGMISPPGKVTTTAPKRRRTSRAGSGHAVAQPFETFRRSDLVVEPAAHLATGVGAQERLDVELAAERVP